MRIIAKYLLMVVVASACLASCTTTEKELNIHSKNGTLSVMASVADFATLNVGTKAISDDEAKVNEITMVIFDDDNNIVGKPVNLDGSGSVFMIDTENSQIIDGNNTPIAITNDQAALDNCTIYMVANSWSEINGKAINDSTALLNIDMPVAGIQIPSTGFPMIGAQRGFDLSKDRGNATTVANITMKKLYAKVNVRFQINAEQVIKTPKFNLQSWQVKNVPNKVRLGYSDIETPFADTTQENMLTSAESTTLSYGVQTISHSESATNPDYFQFTFYVPEHKVQPPYTRATYPKYPTGIPEAEKQRYKPLLCFNTDGSGDNKPMHVIVKGSYTDHHGQVKEVTYSLYLGQNNTDDYRILRNQELNNIITIKGLTNNKDAVEWNDPDNPNQDNISVDHRVEVGQEGFSIAMEREALLDSHFEVRPMDVFVKSGGKVVVSVKNPDANKWLRIEKSNGVDNTNAVAANYISGVGVRKYFTTNLVTEDLATVGRTLTITDSDNPRIWLYFDENTEAPYDKTLDTDTDNPLPKHRDITLEVQYYADANATEVTSTQEYTFRQMKLWRVRGATHYYDIEYHEEYLHNYVSNDNYGKSTDGMAWGLVHENGEGLQLSDYMKSFYLETTFSDVSNALMESSKPYYDFYITEAEANKTQNFRPYSGKTFSNEIMEKVLFEVTDNSLFVSDGLLTSDPKSAVDYCYNKNKRLSNGSIITATTSGNTTTYNTNNVNWFLPSIDQIEEIVKSAYQDFQDFQAKWYWSSQPAYDRYDYNYNAQFGLVDQVSGSFYTDDLSNARATMTVYGGTGWTSASSGSDATNDKTRIGTHTWTSILVWVDHQYSANANYDAGELDSGNQPRTNINRIRCVRNSGLVSSLSSSN